MCFGMVMLAVAASGIFEVVSDVLTSEMCLVELEIRRLLLWAVAVPMCWMCYCIHQSRKCRYPNWHVNDSLVRERKHCPLALCSLRQLIFFKHGISSISRSWQMSHARVSLTD